MTVINTSDVTMSIFGDSIDFDSIFGQTLRFQFDSIPFDAVH